MPPVPDSPVEILVDLLRKANDVAAASASVPEELISHLQKALDIASGLDDYLEKMTTQESEPLAELYQYDISIRIEYNHVTFSIKICFMVKFLSILHF